MNIKFLALTLTLLTGYGCSGGGGGSESTASGERSSAPSNNFPTATRLTDAATRPISCPSAVEKGAMISAPNQSYFEMISLTEQTDIILYTARSDFATFCTLLDQQGGTTVPYEDVTGEGDDCSITASLPAGIYSVEIRAFDNQATGEFYLGSGCVASPPPSSEEPTTEGPDKVSPPPPPEEAPAETPGDISFILTWVHSDSSRTEGPDIDIWVENPKGERLSTSTDGIQLGPDSYEGIINTDDRGGWGDGDGEGPERVFWPENAAPTGTYRVGVRYFEGDGAVIAQVRVSHGDIGEATWFVNLTEPGAAVELGTTDYP